MSNDSMRNVGDRWVVFDLIGVLAEPSWRSMAVEADAAAWRALRVGACDESALWDEESGRAFRRVLAFRRDRLRLVEALAARGVHVAVATNFVSGWLEALRARTPGLPVERVERWFVSDRLRLAKPDPRFYAAVREVVPAGALFVDDQVENCAGASAAGLRAIHARPAVDVAAAVWRALGD